MKIISTKFYILLILFIIALLPRLYHLDQTPIYPDEISWMVRGKESIYAISKLNFGYFNSVWWTDQKEHESIALPLTLSNAASFIVLGKNSSSLSLQLFSDYTAARIPIAFLSSLLIPAFYLLAKKFVGKQTAFLFAILLAFDPIHLALSRWVMNDGLLTLFTFLVISFFLTYKPSLRFQRQNLGLLALTSLSLAAACLTRPTGIIATVPLAILSLSKEKTIIKSLLLFLSTLSLAYLFIWIAWPGLWNRPIISYAEYFLRQATLAQQGITVFFMGQVTDNPPLTYYPFQLVARLPLPILFLLSISPVFFISRIFKNQLTFSKILNYLPQISFAIFSIIFLLALSFSALKIGVRYALPIWPWIYLLAAWTFIQILQVIKQKFVTFVLVLVMLFTSLFTLVKYFPNYYLFYNILIGGPGNAQKYDLVGLCMGTREALQFVNQCYPNLPSVAMIGCSKVTAPYYSKKEVTTNWESEDVVIMENAFAQLLPNNKAVLHFNKINPVYIVNKHGANIAQVYQVNPAIINQCEIK